MKALLFEKYGRPEDVLQLGEIARPEPQENEVLIRVMATAVNDYDWSVLRGKPLVYRLMYGLLKPKMNIPGMELSGEVVGMGAEVRQFEVGDAVFGDISHYGFGTFAEYIAIDAKAVVKMPPGMSFVEAAAIPHAAGLAFQALEDLDRAGKGQRVLINGAGGGVGAVGLQLAKNRGYEVVGVDAQEKLTKMKAMGFDEVLDYRQTDITKVSQRYDLILDCKCCKSIFLFPKILTPKGRYVAIGGEVLSLLQVALFGKILGLLTKQRFQVLSLKSNKDLAKIGDQFNHNLLNTHVDGPFPWTDAPRLIQYFGEGKHQGKIVLMVSD
ncbi:NADPH:quinone reductase-like Zn-dependent oxidoreductase [Dyadobacter jejuensis]|uniref:NADPH:quinone reductase-like Zn-dependent oxidoreductase n=1 Tax=Dyadobacter jejuensis TaxID=1082580 RepID=A0A316ANM1_9BACT|nr:NAD(P)-dependent alcohol dehydrogenase [Dyadobacter jejuensis]PWJ58380.1 NADPH:quinone reductase-like Zn-dependent oxidoreductase [Dyadobacter jejuensis]